MPTFKLTLEYDGTDFAGWQTQHSSLRTVQGELMRALGEITAGPVRLMGAGRTDRGVHAAGQVASAAFETRLDPETLRRALNAKLPGDLAVLGVESMPDGFDARRDARSKRYRYRVWNSEVPSPLRARRSHQVREALALEPMREGAAALLGRHDFSSFRGAGSAVKTSVRTLTRLDIEGAAGAEVAFSFVGDGFLRHMVRNVVGTLLEVGLARRNPTWVAEVLAARGREWAGPTAPACGLTLEAVCYRED